MHATVVTAAPAAPRLAEFVGLYYEGKAITAREGLAALVDGPDLKDPDSRLLALTLLLEVCRRSGAAACLGAYTPKFVDEAGRVAAAQPDRLGLLAFEAAYALDYVRFHHGRFSETAGILDAAAWRIDETQDPRLTLRRRLLAAGVLNRLDRHAEATAMLDKALAMVAALQNPQEDRLETATALAEAMAMLREIGEGERAYGLYRVSGDFTARALPLASADAVRFRLTEAEMLQDAGDLRSAGASLDIAVETLGRIELDAEARTPLLAAALTLKALNCLAQGELGCATAAIEAHPLAALYARAAPAPSSFDALTYLVVRGLASAYRQVPDPTVARALRATYRFEASASLKDLVEAYRAAGAALAEPPGRARQAGLLEAGRRLAEAARRAPPGAFASWRRPTLADRLLVGLALTQAATPGGQADETAFALFQLDGRRGPLREVDSLTALAQAGDQKERSTVHDALRMRDRRDRGEREILAAGVARAVAAPTRTPWVRDAGVEAGLVAQSAALVRIQAALQGGPVSTTGANLVPLERFQALLRSDEAALAVAGVPGGMAYLCVRRDAVSRRVEPIDLAQVRVDARIVEAALTAGHAPSDRLDAQFPAEAAVRLYDRLFRPFEGCLKPGDHILWLPPLALTTLPLGMLLERVPPRADDGYDLAAADWLIRRHTVAYVGSAAILAAARGMPAAAPPERDFLGVGDPLLVGATPTGETRAAILARGEKDIPPLQPLPETRTELVRSAAGFARTVLIIGEEATERRLSREPLGAYRFLSFATHGLLREETPGLPEPALVLTPVTAADPMDDGLLTASDVADLKLSARFVALSACNTANYDLSRLSADLPALTSAFAIAGVPATLATLWAVDSSTSDQVVSAVFASLAADPTADPARALGEAQRAFLANPPGRAWLHPRFWAPFVVIGDAAGEP